jgi:hypothetical protein
MRHALWVVVVLGGCGTDRSQATKTLQPALPPPTISSDRSVIAGSVSDAPTRAADTAALDAGADHTPLDAGPFEASAKRVDYATEWLSPRGATGSLDRFGNVWGCVEIVVGTAREPALVCDEAQEPSRGKDETSVYRVVTHRVAFVVRAHKIVTVLDVEWRLEALDAPHPGPGRSSPAIIELQLTIAPDGMSATLEDARADMMDACPAEIPSARTPQKQGEKGELDAWRAFDDELERRMCNARGGFIWKAGRFVRAPRRR